MLRSDALSVLFLTSICVNNNLRLRKVGLAINEWWWNCSLVNMCENNVTWVWDLSLFTTYSLLNPAGGRRCMSCKNSVKWPGSPWVSVAQWIECPPGVRKVMDSNPIGTQIFSRSHACVILVSQRLNWIIKQLCSLGLLNLRQTMVSYLKVISRPILCLV